MRNMKDSGIEWIGEIPEDWKRTKLKNLIIESNSGEVIDKSYWNIGNEILYSCSKVTIMCNYSKFPEHKRTVKGDLLLTRNATPYIFIPEENAIYTNVVQRIKLNDKVNLRFIKYMLQSSSNSIKGYGDIIESFNMNVWGNTWCTLPSLEEQALIADYLDNKVKEIDNIVSKTKETIEEYKKYKQSVITEAVTKGINPNVEMKDSGIEWIGEIPKDWDVVRLKNVLKERKESNNPIKTDFILSLTANKGVIPYTEKKSGGNKSKEDLSTYKLAYPGDIVVNNMNVISGSVGLSEYLGCVSPVYYTLYPINKFDNVKYFNYVFQSSIFQKSLRGLGNGIMIKESQSGKLNTVRMRISMDKLNTVLLPLPNTHTQELIADYLDNKVKKIDNLISKKQELITQLEQYKKSLIYEYVTGKKEVSPFYAD